jgi:outer membrane immunogenic protein
MMAMISSESGLGADMKRITWKLLLAVAPLGLALGAPALGADLSYKAPLLKAPPYSPYSWTGWYVGVNAGYGVGQQQGNYAFNAGAGAGAVIGNEAFNAIPGGGFGGGQLGYNYQINNVVVGLETDIQGSGISDTRTCMFACAGGNSALIDEKLKWFGTTRARVGWATGPVLTYFTAGAAYGETETGVTTTTNFPGVGTSSMITSATKAGWTWGTGVEAALGGNWTAKAEYLYINLGSASASNGLPAVPFAATFTTKNQEQLFRGGINYRFGPDQSAGIWPTYNWAGLFVGGTFGYGIGRNDSTFVVPPAGGPNAEAFFLSPRGFEGGGIVGYNWQFGRWVAGIDADLQDSSGSGYLTCVFGCNNAVATTIDQKLSWFGTVRGRLGYAIGPALFYGTAGGAYGEVKDSIAQGVPGAPTFAGSFSHSKSGFAVGGGIENKLDVFGLLGPNWTTRTEYLYVDLGSVSDTFVNPPGAGASSQTLTSNLHEHVWRTVVSYKFGGG